MPITLQEISNRALAFSRECKHAESEDADAKSIWDSFFEVFGVSRRRVASCEKRVKKIDGKDDCQRARFGRQGRAAAVSSRQSQLAALPKGP